MALRHHLLQLRGVLTKLTSKLALHQVQEKEKEDRKVCGRLLFAHMHHKELVDQSNRNQRNRRNYQLREIQVRAPSHAGLQIADRIQFYLDQIQYHGTNLLMS